MGRALVVTAGIIGHREESPLRRWTERSQEKKTNKRGLPPPSSIKNPRGSRFGREDGKFTMT